jgi:TonB family protein
MGFRTVFLCGVLLPVCAGTVLSTTTPAQQSGNAAPASANTSAPPAISYPDSAAGLERLSTDIIDALQKGDEGRALTLARSMVLNDPAAWYHQTFGADTSAKEIATYKSERGQIPAAIVGFFKRGVPLGDTKVKTKRFDSQCDDEDGDNTFPLLAARISQAPFYDVRLHHDHQTFRLWPLAYVDGNFRFLDLPRPWDYVPVDAAEKDASAQAEENGNPTSQRGDAKPVPAKLIHSVKPQVSPDAGGRRIRGTVQLHAVIAKDGGISWVRVVKGYCSLAQASLEAVKQWRYAPTLVKGAPVEVPTMIDVSFGVQP